MDPARPPSAAEELLQKEGRAVSVNEETKTRIKQKMLRSIQAPAVLTAARDAVTPPADLSKQLWTRIASRIAPQESLLNRARGFLQPSTDMREVLWGRVLSRLRLAPAAVPSRFPRYARWGAVAALLLVFVRLSPALVMAPRTVAESPVLLLPVSGEVSVLIGGLWQPVTRQIQLQRSALIKTGKDGQATVVLYDDAVVRMRADTTIALNELVDRPAKPENDPSITLYDGNIWFQSFVPEPVTGYMIATAQGDAYVNEGSVSLSQDGDARVRMDVLDRSARFFTDERMLTVQAGNRTEPRRGRVLYAVPLPDDTYATAWVEDNLALDAVHRHEIADMQQKRRAASAGILPSSPVAYAAKRMAERVDVLLTFDSKSRTEKILANATTRVAEAAALSLQQDDTGATQALQEFKDTVIQVATGSGDDLTKTLALQTLADVSADVSASEPEDEGYLLKEAVLQIASELPDTDDAADAEQEPTVLDDIAAVKESIERGDLEVAGEQFAKLQSALDDNSDELSALNIDVQKEARISLQNLNMTLGSSSSSAEPAALETVPVVAVGRAQVVLTSDQLDALVHRMMNRIDIYEQLRSRFNQLQREMEGVEQHPQRASILRRLLRTVGTDELRHFVLLELDSLKTSGQ